jgi:hypothetical protein
VRLGEDGLPREAADLDGRQEHLGPVKRGMPNSVTISIF